MKYLNLIAQNPVLLIALLIFFIMLKLKSTLVINLIKAGITLVMIGAFILNYKRILYNIFFALCNLRFFSIFNLRCTMNVYDNVAPFILSIIVLIFLWMLYESFSAFIPKKK